LGGSGEECGKYMEKNSLKSVRENGCCSLNTLRIATVQRPCNSLICNKEKLTISFLSFSSVCFYILFYHKPTTLKYEFVLFFFSCFECKTEFALKGKQKVYIRKHTHIEMVLCCICQRQAYSAEEFQYQGKVSSSLFSLAIVSFSPHQFLYKLHLIIKS
jgi:hypothetical protein